MTFARSRWIRIGAPLLVVLLALAAVLAVTVLGRPSADRGGRLADELRDAVRIEAIMEDLAELQEIADRHGGMRASGTQGYLASASYVASELRDAGYLVELDTFDVPLFSEVGIGTVDVGEHRFEAGTDFRPMIFSPSGELIARVVAVGYRAGVEPGAQVPGAGCDAADFAAVPPRVILLVQGGPCASRDIVDNAAAADAAALVVANTSWEPGTVRRPTLRTPDVTIPVLGVSRQMGDALHVAAEDDVAVHLSFQTAIVDQPTANVIAETPGGDPAHVIMLGGHLDSVIDGPGINDNGSGSMAVLEIARQLATREPQHKVRVAFWAAEEIGLYGSFRYVSSLVFEERRAIDVYLNFDMLGSPNGGRFVYDPQQAATGTATVTEAFVDYLAAAGLGSEAQDLGAASDHFAFQQGGVPIGGLFSGAGAILDSDAAERFGRGSVGEPYDPCIHLACDRLDNVDPVLLEEMVRAAAYVTGFFASGEIVVRE
jgi:Zn-dependent M28 family amino/carboxypeptidase